MIKNAIILGFLGFIIVFGILFATDFFSKSESQNTLELITSDYLTRARFLSYIIRESVEMEDEIGSNAVLNLFKENFKDVKSLTVISNDGTILADLDSTKILSKYKGTMVGGKEFLKVIEGKNLYIGIPVKIEKNKIGEIHLTIDTNKFGAQRKELLKTNNIIYSGIAFFLFFIVGLFISRAGKKEVVSVLPDKSILEKEVETLKQVITNLKKEEEQTLKLIEEKKKEIEVIEVEIKNKKKEIDTINNEFANLIEKRKEIENLRSELAALEVKISDKKSELEEIEKNIKEIKTRASVESDEEAIMSSVIDNNIDTRLEEKKKQEVELTQRIVAKRREEITISARIEAKKKELLELEKKIEALKKQA